MASTFKFELVSPERILLSEDVEQVVVPGADGDFGVLPGHAPVISLLRPGIIDVTGAGGARRLFVKSGFAEVDPERLTILAEKAYDMADFSADQIAAELKVAEDELAAAKDDATRLRAETAVAQLRSLKG